jgi:hypothetical protein
MYMIEVVFSYSCVTRIKRSSLVHKEERTSVHKTEKKEQYYARLLLTCTNDICT